MDSSVLFEDDVKKMEKYLAIHPKNINICRFDKTPLMNAVEEGRTDLVDMLIDSGANVNLQNKNGYTALHLCCFYQPNNRGILQRLLNAGANPSCITNLEYTPLHIAAERTNDVNIIHDLTLCSNPNFQNNSGDNPLMVACAFNENPEVISALIDITNDLNVRDNSGDTALHSASMENNYSAIRLLLAAGADIYPTNNQDKTAYELADSKAKEIFNEFTK